MKLIDLSTYNMEIPKKISKSAHIEENKRGQESGRNCRMTLIDKSQILDSTILSQNNSA